MSHLHLSCTKEKEMNDIEYPSETSEFATFNVNAHSKEAESESDFGEEVHEVFALNHSSSSDSSQTSEEEEEEEEALLENFKKFNKFKYVKGNEEDEDGINSDIGNL